MSRQTIFLNAASMVFILRLFVVSDYMRMPGNKIIPPGTLRSSSSFLELTEAERNQKLTEGQKKKTQFCIPKKLTTYKTIGPKQNAGFFND